MKLVHYCFHGQHSHYIELLVLFCVCRGKMQTLIELERRREQEWQLPPSHCWCPGSDLKNLHRSWKDLVFPAWTSQNLFHVYHPERRILPSQVLRTRNHRVPSCHFQTCLQKYLLGLWYERLSEAGGPLPSCRPRSAPAAPVRPQWRSHWPCCWSHWTSPQWESPAVSFLNIHNILSTPSWWKIHQKEFYKQVTFLSISYLLYTSCVQIHQQGKIQGGRCRLKCSQKLEDRWLSRLHALGSLAAGKHGVCTPSGSHSMWGWQGRSASWSLGYGTLFYIWRTQCFQPHIP